MKHLVHADCLDVLLDSKRVARGSVGLVYIDPPYGTERLFAAGLRRGRSALSSAEPEAFSDRWDDYVAQAKLSPSVEAATRLAEAAGGRRLGGYVRFMSERLEALAPALSPTASVYVHVSPTVAPYLRVVLDLVLGAQNFRNEIAWRRTHAHSSSRRYGPVHDTILFYARPGFQWHWPKAHVDPSYVEKHYRQADEGGRRYQLVTCTGPGDRTGTGAHYEWRGMLPPPGRHWAWKKEEMERLEAEGRIQYSKNGVPRRVYFADEHKGVAVQDIWTDITRLDSHSDERLGYDTQKPLELLDRIVSASLPANGELVFDGFMGTGTTMLAAERAGANWLGCDVSLKALALALGRLAHQGVSPDTLTWAAGPTSVEEASALARVDADAFGVWAAGMLGMLPDPGMDSRDVIFARSPRGEHAVAGPQVLVPHMQMLATVRSSARYAVSNRPIPTHPNIKLIPVAALTAAAAQRRGFVDLTRCS